MRVLILFAALLVVPLLESAAQQPSPSNRPWYAVGGRGSAEARRGDDKKCRDGEGRNARDRDDDDDDDNRRSDRNTARRDDDNRRSESREARRAREEQERRSRERDGRRSNRDRDDDDDDDDDDNGDRRNRKCEVSAPPPPPPPPGGLETSEISGMVFQDQNGNGARDADEPGIGSWSVTLSGPAGSQSTMTDAQGVFVFSSLANGSYVLCQMQPGGFQMVPTSGTACAGAAGYEFTLTTPVLRDGFDFGNWM